MTLQESIKNTIKIYPYTKPTELNKIQDYLIDLKNCVWGSSSATNFTCKLINLFFKSDNSNFSKLSIVYPEVAFLVWMWKNGHLSNLKGEII